MTDAEVLQRAMGILSRRIAVGYDMRSQHDLITHAAIRLYGERREVFLAYWLDGDKRLIDVEEIAIGSAEAAKFSLSHTLRRAVASNAQFCAFFHNHPNGDPTASKADRQSAERTMHLLAHAGIFVLGSYVIGGEEVEEIITGERCAIVLEDDPSTAPRCHKCNALLEETV